MWKWTMPIYWAYDFSPAIEETDDGVVTLFIEKSIDVFYKQNKYSPLRYFLSISQLRNLFYLMPAFKKHYGMTIYRDNEHPLVKEDPTRRVYWLEIDHWLIEFFHHNSIQDEKPIMIGYDKLESLAVFDTIRKYWNIDDLSQTLKYNELLDKALIWLVNMVSYKSVNRPERGFEEKKKRKDETDFLHLTSM